MIKAIKLETATARAFLIVAGFVCTAAALFFVKWCFANAIAARAPESEVAEFSIRLAPNDPQTHYALAVLNEKTFLLEDLQKSLASFEQAAALAPADYRLWLALGKARERSGDAAGAELAFGRARLLAPSYAQIQWTMGNFLLRRGKTEEASVEIRRAAESSPVYRIPAITTAWQIFDGNLANIKQFLGDAPDLNSALTVFLAEQKRFDEAIASWNTLAPEAKKTTYKTEGEQLLSKLIATKQYRQALTIQKDINDAESETLAIGKIYNGGFEADLERVQGNFFDWQIADGVQPQIGMSVEHKHGGNKSLFIIFNSSDGRDFRSVSQTIAVEPAKKYVFQGFYKSSLKTSTTILWEIVDASDGKILAATKPISANADWTELKMEFTTAENTEGVTLHLVREPCKSSICPISGNIWFDDFSISQ